jgi:hypothetical protein
MGLLYAVLICQFFLMTSVVAEPWLSNRFAQNCAACHSAARRNVAPPKRRCNLSCQGCHVNPNGGGIRNQYGDWLSKYWLKSHNIKLLGQSNLQPLKAQKYGKQPSSGFPAEKVPEGGFLVAETDRFLEESAFDKSDGQSGLIVENDDEFMQRLTSKDPYRLEKHGLISAGGDLRHMVKKGDVDLDSWLMAFDVGVSVKPFSDYVTAVVENRFLQGPDNSGEEKLLTGGAELRSAYVMIDRLPYNTYIMHGFYRPKVGHYNPDHTALSPFMAGLTQRSRYKALSIGTAPNVPYANLHAIFPHNDLAFDQSLGFAYDFGLRFVTYGASLATSGWSTRDKATNFTKEFFAYDIGFYVDPVVFNLELLNHRKEIAENKFAQGATMTAEIKTQLWRHYYLVTNYAKSNIAYNDKEGSVDETMLGLRLFPLTGLDLELLSVAREIHEKKTATASAKTRRQSYLHLQTHVYF